MSDLQEQYLKKDKDYIIRLSAVSPQVRDLVLTEGQGIKVKDINGKEYLDMWASWITSSIGHCRPDVVEVAQAQIGKLDFVPFAGGIITRESCDLAEKMATISPTGIKHFWFTNGGAEANELAIKLARLYWVTLNKTKKYKIVSLATSYHGCTLATLSCSARETVRKFLGTPSPDFIYIPPPDCYRCPLNKTYPGCDLACAETLTQAIEKEGEENIAAS
jgi:adenosylmethionine-8-amino-7-oxononanoate aminotransferase